MKIGNYEIRIPYSISHWLTPHGHGKSTTAKVAETESTHSSSSIIDAQDHRHYHHHNQHQNNDNHSDRLPSLRRIIFIILFSFLALIGFDPFTNAGLNFQLQLKPDGLLTEMWKATPLPVSTCWYIFGTQNAAQFVRGAKPHVVEHGPFCYFMYRFRRVVEWKPNTVIYMERYEFAFDAARSKSLDTQILTVNTPILTAIMLTKNLIERFYLNFIGPLVYNAINAMLSGTGERLVETITARQLMEGRRMRLLQLLDTALRPLQWLGMPNLVDGQMGIFNHSFGVVTSIPAFELGPYEAYRRRADRSKIEGSTKEINEYTVGHIRRYEDRDRFPRFAAPCNRLSGGDGSFYARPIAGDTDRLHVFVQHLCRTLPFVRDREHWRAGTPVVRYTMDREMFNASRAENECFCLRSTASDCDGWHDMSPCVFGLPIGLSFPHFAYSAIRRAEIDGLADVDRDVDRYTGRLEVEDNLGVPLEAKMALQVILTIDPVPSVPTLATLPAAKLPLMWVDIVAGIEDETMKASVAIVSNTIRYGSYGCFGIGILYVAILFRRRQRRSSSPSSPPPPQRQRRTSPETCVQNFATSTESLSPIVSIHE